MSAEKERPARQSLRIKRLAINKEDKTALFSRAVEEKDPFIGSYNKYNLLVAPYAFINLYQMFEECDMLQIAVAAVMQNVDGFGHTFSFLGDDYTQKETPQAKKELILLNDFFAEPNDDESFIALRRKHRMDYEVTGNAAIELIRNNMDELELLQYIPIRSLRMTPLPDKPYIMDVRVRRGGELTTIRKKKYFRKYAQSRENGDVVVWFKDYGDPRTMDLRTGEYKESVPPEYRASEILWFKQPFAGYPYGMPRWIGSVLEVMGRKLAQFVNYDLFHNQGIPPMIVTISNGVLNDESLAELEDAIASWRDPENFNRIFILESTPEGGGIDDKGSARIEIKSLIDYRQNDAMFKDYLEMNAASIRQCFRLSPIYTGGTEAYNRATAFASMSVTEQQVFSPERGTFDDIITRLIWREFNTRLWSFKSLGPKLAGADEINKGVQAFSKIGALSINNAIELANQAFRMDISKIEHAWGNLPWFVVQAMVQRGVMLKGIGEAFEAMDQVMGDDKLQDLQALAEGNGGLTPPSEAPRPSKTKAEIPVIEDDSLFSPAERTLYYKLLTVDQALREQVSGHDITDEDNEL